MSPKYSVPPKVKRILAPWYMAQELSNLYTKDGHSVYLFGAKNSETEAALIHADIQSFGPPEQYDDEVYYWKRLKQAEKDQYLEMRKQIPQLSLKVLHFHQLPRVADLLVHYPLDIPILITIHDQMSQEYIEDAIKVTDACPNVKLVSISDSQRHGTTLPWIETVHNGIDTTEFPYSENERKGLSIIGRQIPKKGIDDGIEIAKRTGLPLTLVGDVTPAEPENLLFFKDVISPQLENPLIHYSPFTARDHLAPIYGSVKAQLFPIKWEEPFGLAIIEAMSCGTPVIAYNRGSVPEIVKDGVTGFIIEPEDGLPRGFNALEPESLVIQKRGIEGMVEAVKRVDEINTKECRTHVEEHFSLKIMAQHYLKLYKKVCET